MFIFDSARIGFVQLRKYSQNSRCRPLICLLAVLATFLLLFRIVLTLETNEMSAIFVLTTKTTQPRPQVFSVNGALTYKKANFRRHWFIKRKILPNLSSVAGYGELCVC